MFAISSPLFPSILNPPVKSLLSEADPKTTSEAAPTWNCPDPFSLPFILKILLFWATNLVGTFKVKSSENVTEQTPPPLNWNVSMASVELSITSTWKLRSTSFPLF